MLRVCSQCLSFKTHVCTYIAPLHFSHRIEVTKHVCTSTYHSHSSSQRFKRDDRTCALSHQKHKTVHTVRHDKTNSTACHTLHDMYPPVVLLKASRQAMHGTRVHVQYTNSMTTCVRMFVLLPPSILNAIDIFPVRRCQSDAPAWVTLEGRPTHGGPTKQFFVRSVAYEQEQQSVFTYVRSRSDLCLVSLASEMFPLGRYRRSIHAWKYFLREFNWLGRGHVRKKQCTKKPSLPAYPPCVPRS